MNASLHKKRKTNQRIPFTSDEDEKLMKIIRNILKSDLISTNSNSSSNSITNVDDSINWMKVSRLMGNRTARQCKERYLHYLSPKINKNKWTSEEDSKLLSEVSRIGKRWKILEKYFNDRTEIDIRNRFYVLQRRISKAVRSKSLVNSMVWLNNQINYNPSVWKNNILNNNSFEISNVNKQNNDKIENNVENESNQNNEEENVEIEMQNNSEQKDNDIDDFFEFIYDFNCIPDMSFDDDQKYYDNDYL